MIALSGQEIENIKILTKQRAKSQMVLTRIGFCDIMTYYEAREGCSDVYYARRPSSDGRHGT